MTDIDNVFVPVTAVAQGFDWLDAFYVARAEAQSLPPDERRRSLAAKVSCLPVEPIAQVNTDNGLWKLLIADQASLLQYGLSYRQEIDVPLSDWVKQYKSNRTVGATVWEERSFFGLLLLTEVMDLRVVGLLSRLYCSPQSPALCVRLDTDRYLFLGHVN